MPWKLCNILSFFLHWHWHKTLRLEVWYRLRQWLSSAPRYIYIYIYMSTHTHTLDLPTRFVCVPTEQCSRPLNNRHWNHFWLSWIKTEIKVINATFTTFHRIFRGFDVFTSCIQCYGKIVHLSFCTSSCGLIESNEYIKRSYSVKLTY